MDKKLTLGLLGVILVGGTGFAFAQQSRKKEEPVAVRTDEENPDLATSKAALVNWYSLHGKVVKPYQSVVATQDNIPLVVVPDQKANVVQTLPKNAVVGQFTSKIVTDYKYFKEGHVFMEVLREGKTYFVSISHIAAA